MSRFIINLILCLNSAFCYELIYFTSNNTTLRTEAEIIEQSERTREELRSLFSCTRTIPVLFESNREADSIIILDRDHNQWHYPSQSENHRDSFVKAVHQALDKLRTYPSARVIIEKLMTNRHKTFIQKGGNQYIASAPDEAINHSMGHAALAMIMDEKKPPIEELKFTNIGTSGTVRWSPTINSKFIEQDYQRRKIPAELVLAHELYHAYDGTRGLLDRRFVSGEDLEFQEATEYRAVWFENQVRKDAGLLYRRFYGNPSDIHSKRDMLDVHDEPIKLKDPCIRWL